MAEQIDKAEELISNIENMKVKGAYLITRVALEALILLAEGVAAKGEPVHQALIAAAGRLQIAQPSMASVANACNYVLIPLNRPEAADITPAAAHQLVVERSQEFLAEFEQAQQQVIEVGTRVIEDSDVIFTHSYTGTLLGIFSRAREAGKQFQVIATESRPYCEGRDMVAELLKLGIPCTLIIDAAIGSYLSQASKSLVGCDSILANGSVVNKMGTQLVGLACHAYGIPLYAAGSILKFSLRSLRGDKVTLLERPDDAGIMPDVPHNRNYLQVENRLFDVTPTQYIEALITDQGVLPPTAVTGFRDNPLFCLS